MKHAMCNLRHGMYSEAGGWGGGEKLYMMDLHIHDQSHDQIENIKYMKLWNQSLYIADEHG